jgi:hypothetical protein
MTSVPRPLLSLAVATLGLTAGVGLLATEPALPPPVPPVRVWGQVVGARVPGSLDVRIVPAGGGDALVRAAATLVRTGGALYYTAEIPADAFVRAAAAGPLSLSLASDGVGAQSPLALGTPSVVPPIVHAVDGDPRLPSSVLVAARVMVSAGATRTVTFTAAIAREGADSTSGTLVWASSLTGETRVAVDMTLTGGSIAVSRVSTTFAGDAIPAHWDLTWLPRSGGEPRVSGRVEARDVETVLVDRLGPGPGLADAPALSSRGSGYPLADGALTLSPADIVGLELETSLATDTAVRSALEGFTLRGGGASTGSDPAAPAGDLALPLHLVDVVALPGGGAFVRGAWLTTRATTLEAPALVGPTGASLPGTWKVRYLSVYERHAPAADY